MNRQIKDCDGIDLLRGLQELVKDPAFAMEKISVGDIDIIKWVHDDTYGTYCGADQIAYGNDLFEVLRKTFC